MEREGSVTAVLGLQRGDEGKGRFVDMLAEEHDVVARFNGGPNAGHTVVLPNGTELDLHLIPSGISHEDTVNVVGDGTYLDPVKLYKEMCTARSKGVTVGPENLKVSLATHVIMPHHIRGDEMRESSNKGQGSTKSGIAQVAGEKQTRVGLRAESLSLGDDELHDIAKNSLRKISRIRDRVNPAQRQRDRQSIDDFVSSIRDLEGSLDITDTAVFLDQQLKAGKKVLAEGAQAFLLDVDHGMYPCVTSSTTTIGGVMTGLGIAPKYIERTIGVIKSTQSHVGGGPFVTEIHDKKLADKLRGTEGDVDAEFGTTTGRARRMGNLDLPQIRRAIMINGVGELALTKLDCLPRYGESIPVCTTYGYGDPENREYKNLAPGSAVELEKCHPIYNNLRSWDENIQNIRKFQQLPRLARDYVDFLEDQLSLPITMIGVGPRRDQVILK